MNLISICSFYIAFFSVQYYNHLKCKEDFIMIQDIAPHRYNNAYYPERQPQPNSYLFFSQDHQVLIKKNR